MDDEEDNFVYFGTPLEDEQENSNRRVKEVKEPAATRSLPIWKQVGSALDPTPKDAAQL
jgi:hypothetical protein